MKKVVIYGLLSSLSIMAHEFLPRHDSPLFVQAVMWFAWFTILFYFFEYALVFSKRALKVIVKDQAVLIPAGYMVLQHLAMFIAPIAEIFVAVLFLGYYAYHLRE